MDTTKTARQRACPLLPTIFGYDDACSLAEAFAGGEADPVAVARLCLDAAPRQASVYISLTEERAMVEAEGARARYAAKIPLSPLDGVPVGWKDLLDVATSVTTAGSALRKNEPPAERDGPLPTLSARAGMVCIGKLNTTEFAFSSIGTNPHFGTPANAHSKEGEPRIPGGSSSGSAVAVASGILPLAMASDTGGSIRIPAAFNGICGFKPTVGRYPREGMIRLTESLDTPGPVARSVRDIIVYDRILRGDPCHCRNPKPASLKGRRFVVDAGMFDDDIVDPAAKTMLSDVVRRLERAGAFVQIRDVPAMRESMRVIAKGWYSAAESFTLLKPLLDDPEKAARMDQRIRKRAEAIRHMDPSLVAGSIFAGRALTKDMAKDLGGDMLILPTLGHGAPLLGELLEHEEVFFDYIKRNVRLTMPGNMLNMPGVSLPAGLDGNVMPLGVTICAAAGLDEAVLEASLAAEEAVVFI